MPPLLNVAPTSRGPAVAACFVAISTGNGRYIHRTVTRNLPNGTRHAQGFTRLYVYRLEHRDGTVRRLVHCRIPATVAAVDFLNKQLGVPPAEAEKAIRQARGGGVQESSERMFGSFELISEEAEEGTIAADSAGECAADFCLDPIIVNPPPTDNAPDPIDECFNNPYSRECGWWGGDDGSGGSGGGGSGGGAAPSEEDEGPLAYAMCVAAGLGAANAYFGIRIREATLALAETKQAEAARRVRVAYEAMEQAIARGESGYSEHEVYKQARKDLEFAEREKEIAEKSLAEGRVGLALATAGVFFACAPLLGAPA